MLHAFEAGLGALDGALDLIEAPFRLAETVQSMVRGVAGLGTLPILRVRALLSMFDGAQSARAVIGATPIRNRERANDGALHQLMSVMVASELVSAMAEVRWTSREESVRIRDIISDRLDTVAITFADAYEDDAADQLNALRRAMVRDVTARGSSLERVTVHVPFVTTPAIVIAHRLYGRAGLEAQTAELVARNAIAHPGFVPGGQPLNVLTGSGVARG